MIGIMMAYWRDARIQTAKGRDMLYSTGLKRTLYDRVLDALENLLDKPAGKRAARWPGATSGCMAQSARASAGEGRCPCQSWRHTRDGYVDNTDGSAGRMAQQKTAPTRRQPRKAQRSKYKYILSQIMW